MANGLGVSARCAAGNAGHVPNDYQFGQTSKIVVPETYIAISKDKDVAISQVADIGLAGDVFTPVPVPMGKPRGGIFRRSINGRPSGHP